jgi:arylsulfatase A-like enzyme
MHIHSPHDARSAVVRFLLVLPVFTIITAFGCIRREEEKGPPAVSLLWVTPYVGEETEIRVPPPQPVRWERKAESVEGWFMPPEAKLRFPVDLREGARLIFRVGAETTVPIREGDLAFRVEYTPKKPLRTEEGEREGPFIVYFTRPEQTPEIFIDWFFLDVPLSSYGTGEGELSFILDGPFAGNPGITTLIGHPSIYYEPEQRHRNVLLIGVDTLRSDSLTPYGAPSYYTPDLQELSTEGVTFTQSRSQSSWTMPSFASMVTGLLPSTISAAIYSGYLSGSATTIAEYLRDNGYATDMVCSNPWLGNRQSGFQQGFDSLWFVTDADAVMSVEEAKEFIEHNSGRDWFCFLHFMDPHVPYKPPAELADRFCDPAYAGSIGRRFDSVDMWKTGEFVPPPEDLAQVRSLYDAEVAYVDSALGSLFAFLRDKGLDESTLIIFAADHGEEFFDHGMFEHGHTQYDELVRLPLIVKGAEFTPGGRIDVSVGNTDIYPTILRYARITVPDWLIGKPLQDFVAGTVPADRLIFGEGNTRGSLKKYAVQWPYKCILDFVTGEARLYDLETDPGEMNDISGDESELTAELSGEIVSAMRPSQTAFHVWMTRSYREPRARFTGTLRVPGGIKEVTAFQLTDEDSYTVEGDTLTFDVMSALELLGPNKHFVIVPVEGADTLEATILINGEVRPDRFFPYGNRTPEPSCTATVKIGDFPLGTALPYAIEEFPATFYLWGVVGYDGEESPSDMDTETLEQLRSLGYAAD